MRKSKLSRALIVFLALLTAISPVGINAAEGTSTTTSIEEVRELLEAQTYYDYLQENNNLGITDGEGSVTINAAENFTFEADGGYWNLPNELLADGCALLEKIGRQLVAKVEYYKANPEA